MASAKLTYIGHATVLIEMDGVRLLTDPILRTRVWHLRRQKTPLDPDWYQDLDAVLISHIHWDHLDLPSLRRLDRNTRTIVPTGAAPLLEREGFGHVEELSTGQSTRVGSVTIEATQADHDGTRLGFGSAETLGFVTRGSYSIYFPGDTDIFPEMAALAGTLDVALLPVWGWGPNLGTGHLNPYRAAKALKLLRPRLAIPIHWGTFFPIGLRWLLPHLLTDPPQAFTLFAAAAAAEVKTLILLPGSSVSLNTALGDRANDAADQ